jgi:hypothetical protein
VTLFISGLLVAGYLVAALHFLRFWRQSRDRLFAFFSASFACLAAQRAALALFGDPSTPYAWLYVLRLFAFLLILWAIVDKNRPGR